MEGRFETFTVLISSINRCIKKIKAEEMAEYDLKSIHVSCLYYLHKNESLTAKKLCELCDEDKANISRSLEYLEERGYLTCDTKTQKRYNSPLNITEKGARVADIISAKIDRVLEEASIGLSEQSRKTMYESLAMISENLQNICEGYTD